MPPPPKRPNHFDPQQQQHARLLTRRTPPLSDLSLSLPPLRTGIPAAPPTSSTVPGSAVLHTFNAAHMAQLTRDRHAAAPGAGAANSLALVRHKIGTLRQLLQPCPRAKKEGGKRGAIIAVEGDSPSAAREMADWLGKVMGGLRDVTVVDGPKVPEKEVRVEELLRTVAGWHGKGREMVGVVVGVENERVREEEEEEEGGKEVVVVGGEGRKDSKGSEMEEDLSVREEKEKLLVLKGYVLTATNLFAARIPLTGKYDPKGHWEWTACIWRGIVAPDIIVYVKDVEAEDGGELGGCEVLDDRTLMVVGRRKGEQDGSGVDGVQAGALRRLGFEVGEWLRDFQG